MTTTFSCSTPFSMAKFFVYSEFAITFSTLFKTLFALLFKELPLA